MAADESIGEQFDKIRRTGHGDLYNRGAHIRTVTPFTDEQGRPSWLIHGLVTNIDRRGVGSTAPLLKLGRAVTKQADIEGRWIHTSAPNPKLLKFYKKAGGFEEGGEGGFDMGDVPLVRRPQTWKRTYTQGKLF